MKPTLPSVTDRVFLLVLLVASLTANVILFYKLHSHVTTTVAAAAGTARSSLVGVRLPPLHGMNPEGEEVTVSFGTRRTILYVLSPTCPYCRANAAAIQALAAQQSSYRLVVVALSTQDLAVYLREHPIRADNVISDVPEQYRREYSLVATPATIVVSEQGMVLAHWTGLYRPAVRGEIETYFNVSLPAVE